MTGEEADLANGPRAPFAISDLGSGIWDLKVDRFTVRALSSSSSSFED